MRQLLFAVLAMMASPLAAHQAADVVPAAPPRDQPPNATIAAEPVALFIAACDGNADALVVASELTACVTRSFTSVDRSGAGVIGYIQFADWAERWLGDRNALPSPFETDGDGDNRLTLDEVLAQFGKTFTRFDRDKDGTLKRSELLTLDSGRGLGGNPAQRAPRGRQQRP